MRFFSNEAKDNAEDQDDRTVAVPQQRAGSPWGDAPGDTGQVVHDPAPQPTAFGAGTVGGAVAASAAAGPYDDADRDTHRATDAASGVADDRSVAPGDGAVGDRRLADDDTVAWPAGAAPADRQPDAGPDPEVDLPLEDRPGDTAADGALRDRGTFDDPHVAGEEHARTGEEPADRAGHPTVDEAIEDRGTFDDPHVVADTATTPDRAEPVAAAAEPVTAAGTGGPDRAQPEPVVAVAAAGSGGTAAGGPASFFPEAETQPLRERWRDIQLRFVDDPKGSTAEAAALVDETIEKLTDALRRHRGSLASGADDTEALRVELRAYRDVLDRLLGL
ncbi:hypothetical protein [Actinoplanes teichomyceticus]|uniref:Uncharacterized protein n=1 Tax=Actinoplanes teichomyceticus TaxID=1867 RepID=A0A561VG87_ACTTI|nr:hypothetical protein [Actinoplanes teichomyceticus]TWG10619.1 hypothetical protein FHX34_107111 [Actinoplanes teichomyceticus]GIF15388.1 hypothetical protein Ate01nite_54200 [Actinoplanes teichomyceticus]